MEEDHRQYASRQPDDQPGFLVHHPGSFGQGELRLRRRELFGGGACAQHQLLRGHGPRPGRRTDPHRVAGRPETGVPELQTVRQRFPYAVCRGGDQLQPDVRRKARGRRPAARLRQGLPVAGGHERLPQVAAQPFARPCRPSYLCLRQALPDRGQHRFQRFGELRQGQAHGRIPRRGYRLGGLRGELPAQQRGADVVQDPCVGRAGRQRSDPQYAFHLPGYDQQRRQRLRQPRRQLRPRGRRYRRRSHGQSGRDVGGVDQIQRRYRNRVFQRVENQCRLLLRAA